MDPRGIPLGLNRIKTSRSRPLDWSSSGGDDSPAASRGADGAAAPSGDGNQRIGHGFRKGKKLSRWFSSYLISKGSAKVSKVTSSSTKIVEKKPDMLLLGRKELVENKDQKKSLDRKNSGKERTHVRKTKKGQKSFSHELGLQGGVAPEQSRARSYSDLEELLGSLHSMYDVAKEEVDADLASLLEDIQDDLEGSFLESRETTADLLVLVQQCREMPSHEFRQKCGGIVQDLADKVKQSPDGLLKKLLTHILFILTRCTRLLQFQNNDKTIYEDSIQKFKQCLDSIPTIEMSWEPKHEVSDISFYSALRRNDVSQCKFEGASQIDIGSTTNYGVDPEIDISESSKISKPSPYSKDAVLPHDHIFPQALGIKQREVVPHNAEKFSPGSDLVICRICEENIPPNHLESHSYICAYAEKCDLEGTDVDERLLKAAEMLEQIVESYNQNFHTKKNITDELITQNTATGTWSPKIQEWHNKGAEGMFEDLHEMDTSFIDESQPVCFNSLKAHLSMKFGLSDVASTGSSTPASSGTTPRANHFDLFWLEYNNPSEQEDVNQMTDLASLAHKVANFDISNEKALDYLRNCMNSLEDIVLNCKLRALVVDTFGSRIVNLLKEKYLLAVKLASTKPISGTQTIEAGKCNITSEPQTAPLNSHLPYKERMSIDDFKIIKPISRGAFGKVFLAQKRTTGDLFAIKVLKKVNMIRKNDIERILSERNILITTRNPFVVRFFYSFTCRDSLYLVMEYLNGGDLYSLLRKVNCLEEAVARIYIAELVLALEYLHSLGIVHRDLKPDNILVAGDGHIKLTDFGLSKIGLLKSASDLSGSRTNNAVLGVRERTRKSAMGTPDYLAPEILLGTEHGFTADWWSVGVILFEFITGTPPFSDGHPEAIFDNILNRRIPWPDVPKDMSNGAKDLIDRLLVQDPDLRLGVNGASEVKLHPFFQNIDWENFASQKAAFIPNPDSADDTSYFMSRYSSNSIHFSDSNDPSGFVTDATDTSSNPDLEIDEHGDMKSTTDANSLDLSMIRFSFKNLSQLASMNHDVLMRSGKASKSSSPITGPSTPQTD